MTVPLHRVRNYEELEGAQGREVFFRPERYRAKDLLPLRSEAVITLGGSERICPLLDLSENGAAFEWPNTFLPAIGDRLPSLSVRFDAHVSYRGEARVGSLREIDGATIVGDGADTTGSMRAFEWTAATGMKSLGSLYGLGSGSFFVYANGISGDGHHVVGWGNNRSKSRYEAYTTN